MTFAQALAFVQKQKYAVEASVAAGGAPQAAMVGIATGDDFEIVFDTLGATRKATNLRREPQVALVVGTDGPITVQIEGVADEPQGAELARLKRLYFSAFPDGPTRESWPGITYFRVRPTWIRWSDFSDPDARVTVVHDTRGR